MRQRGQPRAGQSRLRCACCGRVFFVRAKDAAGARQAACAGQGWAAGRAMRTHIGKISGLQGKSTARLPIIVHGRWLMNRCEASHFVWASSYTRAAARRSGSRRRHPPGRCLEKYGLANAMSVSKAAWLGHPSPTPSARVRWWPRARSPSARGGRCAQDGARTMLLESSRAEKKRASVFLSARLSEAEKAPKGRV